MPRMETLDLSGTAPRSENWLKSLLWPTIQNAADMDYLGLQGFWVCVIVAILDFIPAFTGAWITSILAAVFFYLGAVGVREHSRVAAACVLLLFVLNLILQPGVLGLLIAALLLSNLRATWISASWKPGSDQAAPPPRLAETWSDKFSDQFPRWLWPKIRILYDVFATAMLVLAVIGVAVHFVHPHLPPGFPQ
jgi:hypothetical protein